MDTLVLGGSALRFTVDDARRELAGRDLACWCPLDQPCHADVLLRVANAPPRGGPRAPWPRRAILWG